MADFNSDNQKTDAALHGLAEQAAGKADAAALAAAVSRVTALEDGKADKTALSAEQTARQNADNAEKAAREAADATQLSTLRSENMWVKLGEVTLKQAGPQMGITVANTERYARIWGQYMLRGPKAVSFLSGESYSLTLFRLEAYNSTLAIGTIDLICCGSSAYFQIESHIQDGHNTWGRSGLSLREDSGLSGSIQFKMSTGDEDLAAGAYMVLYGLKK